MLKTNKMHHDEFDEVATNESSVTSFYTRHPVNVNMASLQNFDT
jgi:hypothetical protein